MPRLLPAARCALTAPFHPYLGTRGGLLSVALSLGSPPPEVIRHRASKEPGLSSLPADTLATGRAAIRPADRANKGLWPPRVKQRRGFDIWTPGLYVLTYGRAHHRETPRRPHQAGQTQGRRRGSHVDCADRRRLAACRVSEAEAKGEAR